MTDPKQSAPQAESVPSDKDAAREWLQREHSAFVDAINHGCVILPEDVASKCEQYAASQTAALREQLKSAVSQLATQHDLKHEAERSNSLLRERLTAAERLLRKSVEGTGWHDKSLIAAVDDYFFKENQ